LQRPGHGPLDTELPKPFTTETIPNFQYGIHTVKEVTPGDEPFRFREAQGRTRLKQLVQVESFRDRALRVAGVNDAQWNYDGAAPRRHFVKPTARHQHHFGRDRRYELPRIEPEETEVQLDVTIASLKPSQLENAFPSRAQTRVIDI